MLERYTDAEKKTIAGLTFEALTPEQQQNYMLMQAYVANNAIDLPNILRRLDSLEEATTTLMNLYQSNATPNPTPSVPPEDSQPPNTVYPVPATVPSETAASGVTGGESVQSDPPVVATIDPQPVTTPTTDVSPQPETPAVDASATQPTTTLPVTQDPTDAPPF